MKEKTSNFFENNRKQKIIIGVAILIVLLILIIGLVVANHLSSLEDYDMSNVSFSDLTVTYDGNEHSIEITGDLPDGVTVSYTYDGESLEGETDAGEYTVVASFTGDTTEYNTISDMTANLTIEQAGLSDSLSFKDSTVAYDGDEHSIEITGDLPDTAIVSYTYNSEDVSGVTNAGTYDVLATITNTSSNYSESSFELEATLTIETASLDLDSVTFEDDTVSFDGYSHSITASNIPDGVSVSYTYDGNDVSDETAVGEYTVVATFTEDNYTTATLTATLTINDEIEYEYTLSGNNVTLTSYTGTDTDVIVPTEISIDGEIYTVTELGGYCFEYDTTIVSIEISKEIETVSYDCFIGCSNLTTVVFDGDVTEFGSKCFEDCTSLVNITIPTTLVTLAHDCFQNCTSLKSVEIPSGITTLEGSTFNGCSNLSTVIFDGEIYEFGSSEFYGCTSLSSITLPDSLTSMGNACFAKCTSLTSITLPSSLTSINEYCFNYDSALTNIYFEDTNSAWDGTSSVDGKEDLTISVSNSVDNATYFTSTYIFYNWTKEE